MGIITGYICLLCVVLLLLKFIAKRLNITKLNAFLMKIHKHVACGFLLVGMIHFALVINVLDTRNLIVVISGILCLAAGFMLTAVCHLMKNRKKEICFHRLFSIIIFVMLVLHILFYYVDFNSYKQSVGAITIEEVDLSDIDDGEYMGSYDVGYIYVKVRVRVENHAISEVRILEHRNERGKNAESVIKSIIAEQRVDVDAVSGATNSSLVIKKACENALRGR